MREQIKKHEVSQTQIARFLTGFGAFDQPRASVALCRSKNVNRYLESISLCMFLSTVLFRYSPPSLNIYPQH